MHIYIGNTFQGLQHVYAQHLQPRTMPDASCNSQRKHTGMAACVARQILQSSCYCNPIEGLVLCHLNPVRFAFSL